MTTTVCFAFVSLEALGLETLITLGLAKVDTIKKKSNNINNISIDNDGIIKTNNLDIGNYKLTIQYSYNNIINEIEYQIINNPKIIYEKNPKELVEKLIQLIKKEKKLNNPIYDLLNSRSFF